MKRYIANITIHRDGKKQWATQMFTSWPSKRRSTANRIARQYDSEWARAEVTSIEEV